MNSCVYTLKLSHERLEPKKNSFSYSMYMMYLDLDELSSLSSNLRLFSFNKWNIFSYFDQDHFKFINEGRAINQIIALEKIKYDASSYLNKSTKEKILILAKELKLDFVIDKVYILTNLRNFGYIFNPVSFYYCFDDKGVLRLMFSEVNNTFGDQKMYYTIIENPDDKVFTSIQKKNYYISPFISYDNNLRWRFTVPGEKMVMGIDSMKQDRVELKTLLLGNKRPINNLTLFWLQLRFPVITLMIIVLIHYQALKLFIKKVKFFKKDETDQEIVNNIKK